MNPQSQSNTIKKIAVPLLIAVLALGIGYYSGQYIGRQKQDQMLKEIFRNVGFANTLSGKITAISPDKHSVSVEVPNVAGANLPKDYRDKTVLITGDTKVILRENKSQEVLRAEIKKYQEEVKKAKDAMTVAPPLPYSEKAITVGELRVGDEITFSFKSEADGGATLLNHQFTALTVAVTR